MPAELSSAIPAALIQLTHANSLQETEAPHLLAYPATISDPRATRGRRHPLVVILAMAAAAVLAGARSMAAIAEWAADAPELVRVALGARRDGPAHWVVPSEATIRRTLARLDAEALAEVIGAWLADRDRPDQRRRRWAVAVDGKTLRGASVTAAPFTCWPPWSTPPVGCWPNAPSTAPPARCPASSRCWPIWTWPGRWSRLMHSTPMLRPQKFLVTTKRADYLFSVKANQPTLLNRCARLAWRQVPVLDRTRHRAHGRVEIRLRSRRWRTVVVYAVTSLAHARASPARLADLLRGHWSIENGLHWVRDVTFTEDASQVRSGTARRSWPACATWPSACCAGPGRSTSPPRSGFTAATPTDPWRPGGSASGWVSPYSFPATMLKLRLSQRPASRHRWLSAEPAGCSGPRQTECIPRRRCPVVPSLSSQAILMDYCLEGRALVHSDAGW